MKEEEKTPGRIEYGTGASDIKGLSTYQKYLQGRGELPSDEREKCLVAAVQQLKGFAEQIKDGTVLAYAAVVGIRDKHVLLNNGEQIAASPLPTYLSTMPVPGDLVRVSDNGSIVYVDPDPPAAGKFFDVVREVSDGIVEVDDGRIAYDRKKSAKVGHRVLLDFTLSCIVRDYGKPASTLAFTEETGVTWDDIGGQEEAKREIRECIEGPLLHAELYREFGATVSKGVLLFGPPGNGKTMFAKAAHSSIASLTGKAESPTGYIYVKGPEVLASYHGETEAAVRKVFAAGRAHFEEHGYPATIVVDEADAVLSKRSDSKLTLQTVVPQFLAEMDGMAASHVFVMILTNRPDSLDPAIVRPGRIDRKIEVGKPDAAGAEAILTRSLSKRLLAHEAPALAKAALEEIGSRKNDLCMVRVHRGEDRRVGLADFVSGAMLVNLVDRATILAIRRAQAGEGARGITAADMIAAVQDAPGQIRKTNTDDDIAAIVSEHCGGPDNIKKLDWL
jgi:proteasome-associated ATPase